jgi:hypothetical protein
MHFFGHKSTFLTLFYTTSELLVNVYLRSKSYFRSYSNSYGLQPFEMFRLVI